jgi:hypothetical protein
MPKNDHRTIFDHRLTDEEHAATLLIVRDSLRVRGSLIVHDTSDSA